MTRSKLLGASLAKLLRFRNALDLSKQLDSSPIYEYPRTIWTSVKLAERWQLLHRSLAFLKLDLEMGPEMKIHQIQACIVV